MSYQEIRYVVEDHVAWVRMNRPDAMNSLSYQMLSELRSALAEAELDHVVRVIVLTGEGRAFSAGGDVKGMQSRLDQQVPAAEHEARYQANFGMCVRAISQVKKPVVAMINGPAYGGGVGLALACDIRVAGSRAKLGFVFVHRGLIPDCGTTFFLPRLVGVARAMELALAGRVVDAAAAQEMGLVNAVFSDDGLEAFTREVCRDIVNAAPYAVQMTKRALRNALAGDLEGALEFEAKAQAICQTTADHREGILAFLEKRAPQFHGM